MNNDTVICDRCENPNGWVDEFTGGNICDECNDADYERWCENGENWIPSKPIIQPDTLISMVGR